jgi:hypothetical protein
MATLTEAALSANATPPMANNSKNTDSKLTTLNLLFISPLLS